MSDETRCYVVHIDGEPVRVQGGREPVTDADLEALTEVVRAAKRRMAELPPSPLSVSCPACGSEPGRFCRTLDAHRRVTAVHAERRALIEDSGSPASTGEQTTRPHPTQ